MTATVSLATATDSIAGTCFFFTTRFFATCCVSVSCCICSGMGGGSVIVTSVSAAVCFFFTIRFFGMVSGGVMASILYPSDSIAALCTVCNAGSTSMFLNSGDSWMVCMISSSGMPYFLENVFTTHKWKSAMCLNNTCNVAAYASRCVFTSIGTYGMVCL